MQSIEMKIAPATIYSNRFTNKASKVIKMKRGKKQ